MICAWPPCSRPFKPNPRRRKRYCSVPCQQHGLRKRMRELRAAERAKRVDMPRHKPAVRRARLECKWCGMGHITTACQRNRNVVKLYGTVDADGRYVPPPGVTVRHVQIPQNIHGDRLGKILKELGR